MTAPSLRLTSLRLAMLLLAAWALLAQGFAAGLGDRIALQSDALAVLCTHGGADGTPATPGLPDTCSCPLTCAASVALPSPPAPGMPLRFARIEQRGARFGFSILDRPRFVGPPPGRGPPVDLA